MNQEREFIPSFIAFYWKVVNVNSSVATEGKICKFHGRVKPCEATKVNWAVLQQ